jgi:hypothetical protein
MFELPTEIKIKDKSYKIRNNGDFRMVLDCFSALGDEELDIQFRVISSLIIFYDGLTDIEDTLETFEDDIEEAVLQMYNFFNCGEKSIGLQSNYKLIDWEQDSQLIASAVNDVAKKEIRSEPYIHWWTFMGYFLGIGECALSNIIEIRRKIKKHTKLEKYEQEFKQQNPQYFIWDSQSVEEKQAQDIIKKIWNKGR